MNNEAADQLPSLRKPNEVLVMISKEKGLTPTARKLYTVLLWEAQQQIKDMGRVPEATHLFEMSLGRALSLAGSSANSRTIAQGYLKEMRKSSITWESPGVSNGPEWTDMALLSHASFEMKNGERFVQWAFPPNLIKALLDPRTWTLQHIPILAKLDSYAAIALYDVCSRYKTNPTGVTNRDTPDWWVAALTSARKKREWRKIKNECVASAIEEINEKTDIEVALIEHKVGRAVVEVQFSVKKKNASIPQQPGSELPKLDEQKPSESEGLNAMIDGLNIKPAQISMLVSQYSEERLASALSELKKRVANTALPQVHSHWSYLNSILVPGSTPGRTGREDGYRPAPADAPPQPQATRQAPTLIEPVEDEAVIARQERFNNTVAVIAQMDPSLRKELILEMAADLKSRNMLTPSMARRVREEDWTSPLLKAEMVKRYLAKYE